MNTAPLDRPTGYRSGVVTGLSPTPPTPPASPVPAGVAPPPDPGRRDRRMLWWFGGAAIGVVAIGVVTLLVLVVTGGGGPFGRRLAGPSDTRPDLAKLCPPPSQDAASGAPAAPPPAGPRTVDADSGISYAAYGDPWLPWRDIWTKGTLHVSYRSGQYFVTETYVDSDGFQNEYLASVLSGSVPAANNDTLSLDLRCTGRQVAADVRAEYYPQPNTVEMLRDEQTTLGGRPAWVTKFRMHFHRAGLKATDELVGLALVDVGRPRAAVLYVSIPGTHHKYDWVVDDVLDSVRPVG
ncbi:hypothetical protein HC031_07465 [Planosporangium thailandense]|uniref:Serine/threonine protein kinase n=1 Tax=Planosporangium thailandense TaxID=765197 RepID=A0ABX0XWF5_9ACTN|nr:hypothetical protein [Planosporangium thailandense]